jgi:hypothetical protein
MTMASNRVGVAGLALFGLASVHGSPLGQSWGPWAPVSTAQCPCSPPHEVDDRCVATVTGCDRRDAGPTISAAGTPRTVLSAILRCISCPPCCPDCPPAQTSCTGTVTASYTQSATVSTSSQLQADAIFIKSQLQASVGWTETLQLTVTQTCGVPQQSVCTRIYVQGFINVIEGRRAQMLHEWRQNGTWGGTTGCPIPAGTPWTQPCGSAVSTCTVNLATDQGCTTLCLDKCSPGDCDNF